MSFLVKNITRQIIRNQRQLLIQCSQFATDGKIIEDMTKKSKVVVFMKVRKMTFLSRDQNSLDIMKL